MICNFTRNFFFISLPNLFLIICNAIWYPEKTSGMSQKVSSDDRLEAFVFADDLESCMYKSCIYQNYFRIQSYSLLVSNYKTSFTVFDQELEQWVVEIFLDIFCLINEISTYIPPWSIIAHKILIVTKLSYT